MARARQKHALRAHVMPGGVAAVMCGPLGCLAAHFGLMRTLRLLDMIGTRRCAFCGLHPCGVRAWGRCGLGSRSVCAEELACACESVCHVELLRLSSSYILHGLRTGRSRVYF